MSLDSCPLTPHSQAAEDQSPLKPDTKTDSGYLAEQFLADSPSPTRDEIGDAMAKAESLLSNAAEFERISAEIELAKENLAKTVSALYLARRNKNFVRIMRNPNNSRRKSIIEDDFKGDEQAAMRATEHIERPEGKLDQLQRESRKAFQRAYFNGKTLEEIEQTCDEKDDTAGLDYWRPEVQSQYKKFEKIKEDYKGKKVPDDQYEEWAICLIQRRDHFVSSILTIYNE